MEIAASLCIYTNTNIVVDSIGPGVAPAAALDGSLGTGE
jgi:hypothetical protein